MNHFIALILWGFYSSAAEEKCIVNSNLYDNIHLDEPMQENVTDVTVQFHNLQIVTVNDFDCTITLNFLLSLTWYEPRLKYPCKTKEYVNLPKTATNWLWVPNIFIFDVKSVETHAITRSIYDFFIQLDENVTQAEFNFRLRFLKCLLRLQMPRLSSFRFRKIGEFYKDLGP